MKTDAQKFKELRHAVGLSQEGLARRASVSVSTVANWECGRSAPAAIKYPDIAAALLVSIEQVQSAVRLIEIEIIRRQACVAAGESEQPRLSRGAGQR